MLAFEHLDIVSHSNSSTFVYRLIYSKPITVIPVSGDCGERE